MLPGPVILGPPEISIDLISMSIYIYIYYIYVLYIIGRWFWSATFYIFLELAHLFKTSSDVTWHKQRGKVGLVDIAISSPHCYGVLQDNNWGKTCFDMGKWQEITSLRTSQRINYDQDYQRGSNFTKKWLISTHMKEQYLSISQFGC